MSKTQQVMMELPAIEGYEYTGEFREARGGEYFMKCGLAVSNNYVQAPLAPILRKIVTYRGVKWPEDWGREVEVMAEKGSVWCGDRILVGLTRDGQYVTSYGTEYATRLLGHARIKE